MKTKLFLMLVLGLTLTIGSVQAQARPGFRQKARIAHGYRQGEITRPEARLLMKEQRRIHRHTRRAYLNDGHIGPVERRHLHRERKRASRHIYMARHNRFHK